MEYLEQSNSLLQLQAGIPHPEALQALPAFLQGNKVHQVSCYEEAKCYSSSRPINMPEGKKKSVMKLLRKGKTQMS